MVAFWLMTATWAAGAPVEPPAAEYTPAPPPMVRVISSGGVRMMPDYTGRTGGPAGAPQASPYHATMVPQSGAAVPVLVTPGAAPTPVTVYSSPAASAAPYAYAKPAASPPLSARDQVGHEHDYSWITGCLYFVHTDGGRWVLRYAELDQVDRYGGSVVLAPGTDMANYREGDLVRVHGAVLGEGRASRSLGGALYRADVIEMVDRR
jgi:hypothetical protein